jgi:hypothetical protein
MEFPPSPGSRRPQAPPEWQLGKIRIYYIIRLISIIRFIVEQEGRRVKLFLEAGAPKLLLHGNRARIEDECGIQLGMIADGCVLVWCFSEKFTYRHSGLDPESRNAFKNSGFLLSQE